MAPARIPQELVFADVRRLAAQHPRLTWTILRRHGQYAVRTYEQRGAPRLAELLRLSGVPRRAEAQTVPLPAALVALAAWPANWFVDVWRAVRWPDPFHPLDKGLIVCCPRCGDAGSVREFPTQRLGRSGELAVYGCSDCAYHFSDVTDSIFHGLMMPLRVASLVLVAARLGVPRTRLMAFGLGRDGGARLARRAAESRLAQAYVDRLLSAAIPEQEACAR